MTECVPAGWTRLWRLDSGDSEVVPVAAWIAETAAYRNMLAARGRWFTDDLEEAEWYAREHPGGRIVCVDLPSDEAERFRVSGMEPKQRDEEDSPRAWSARPWKEFFLPAELAARAEPPAAAPSGMASR